MRFTILIVGKDFQYLTIWNILLFKVVSLWQSARQNFKQIPITARDLTEIWSSRAIKPCTTATGKVQTISILKFKNQYWFSKNEVKCSGSWRGWWTDPPRGGKITKKQATKKEEIIGRRGARGRRLGCSVVKSLAQSQAGPGTSTARYSGSSK